LDKIKLKSFGEIMGKKGEMEVRKRIFVKKDEELWVERG